MNFAPQLFLGQVMHRRLRPVVNAFVYPVFYVALPLRKLAVANCGIFSVDRWNVLSFRQRDHGARDGSPLLPWIENLLRDNGLPADGEIMLIDEISGGNMRVYKGDQYIQPLDLTKMILENHRAKECDATLMSIKEIITLIPEE